MFLVGDCHGLFVELRELHEKLDHQPTVILGDIGFGFGKDNLFPHHENLKALRGNHDSPVVCSNIPCCLGDYGYQDIGGFKLFFLSGAWSIDYYSCTEGVDWWSDEELDYESFRSASDLYCKHKPELVITHACPYSVVDKALGDQRGWGGDIIRTRTNSALQYMFEIHQPKLWVFAHYHHSVQFEYNGTKFVCLNELEVYEI